MLNEYMYQVLLNTPLVRSSDAVVVWRCLVQNKWVEVCERFT